MFNPESFAQNMKGRNRRASIILVTFNRWASTQLTLQSIFDYTFLPHTLTVVDNASWDGTPEKLKRLKRSGKIDKLILLPENRGIGMGKNFGLKATKADWYCCIDNDIVVSPHWLSYLCYASTLPQLGVVGCNVQGFGEPGGLKWYRITHWKTVDGVILDNCPNPGGIYVMSAKTFGKLGYFREWSLYGLEDSDLHSRQVAHGLRSAYVRNVECKELKDEAFSMKIGGSYRDFKTNTHLAIVAKVKAQHKLGTYQNLKHYETRVTDQEIERFTYR